MTTKNSFIQKFGKRANFAYEVVSQVGETSKMTWEENGIQYSSLKSDYIFKSLGDCESLCDKFLCTLYDEDAEKSLRPGEMISAKLKFDVCTNIDGIYVAGDTRVKQLRQLVTATSDGAIAATEAIKYINE